MSKTGTETRKCVLIHGIHKPNHVQIVVSTMMKSETTEEIIKKVQTNIKKKAYVVIRIHKTNNERS